ncbi:hypothetical protein Leryth_010943 [Lithospermum erythrorhizon]|nr:hypothetical protein Leryth_010943 [Lithospermum erythrorhizon]
MIANGRKNRSRRGGGGGEGCSEDGYMGSQESSQDVYNIGFSSQESLGEFSGLNLSSQESLEGYYRKGKKVKISVGDDSENSKILAGFRGFGRRNGDDLENSKNSGEFRGFGRRNGDDSENSKILAGFRGFGRRNSEGSENLEDSDKGFVSKSSTLKLDEDSDPYGFNSLQESLEFKSVFEAKNVKKGRILNGKENVVLVKNKKKGKISDGDNSKNSVEFRRFGGRNGGGSENLEDSDKGFVSKSSTLKLDEDSDPYGFNSLQESMEFNHVIEDAQNAKKGRALNGKENVVLVKNKKKKKKGKISDSDDSENSKSLGEFTGYGPRNGEGTENLEDSENGCVSKSSILKLDEDSDPYGFNLLQESTEFNNVFEDAQNAKKGRTLNGKDNGVLVKTKKKSKEQKEGGSLDSKTRTVTLMESQESGEMMDDMDEVNFSALDGLRKGQPVRIRRESLLSLLRNCGTSQQRQLLRAHGLAKTIMNSILGLSLDDSPSNLAAATLFYILTNNGQDDRLLSSSNCIRFIIKLLKPVARDSGNVKPPTIGSKLLSLHKDASCSQESVKGLDSTARAIMKRVHDILLSCEEFKLEDGDDYWNERPELDPKWIALLTMEKACLSKISIEDLSGITFKAGGSFKEKLRELGGLDAIFEVARSCHNRMKGWSDQSGSLVLLLKCLKIMENATFFSKDNQSHLLEMKGNFDNRPAPRSFVKLLLSVVKILSDMSLRCFSNNPDDENCGQARRTIACNKVESFELGRTSSQPITVDSELVNSSNGMLKGHNGSRKMFPSSNREQVAESSKFNHTDVSEDPFAFDEEDFVSSKWNSVSGRTKIPLSQSSSEMVSEQEDGPQILSQQELNAKVASCSATADQKASSLVAECLLTAVKALMNLTNENPLGCQQIAASGGLEILSSLITAHFSSFSMPMGSSMSLKSSCEVGLQNDRRLADQELDFLVAVLGLLVNLVEKDGHNRSRLASTRVAPPALKSSNEESCGDVVPLLCSIFLANQGAAEMAEEGRSFSWDDNDAISQGQKEAEKMIIEAYAALLLAFLSTESKSIRDAIAKCLPDRSLSILVPVLERFAEFHFTLNMISSETHSTVLQVIESCRVP